MALSLSTQWECRTTGSDTACSGGFNTSNANMATDGAATSATGSSPVFSSASYNFVSADVGAWLFIQSGTNWLPGWYQIASVASNNATLSAAIGQGVVYPGALPTSNFALQMATTVAGVATTGSPTAAVWSIDYSQQNAAQFAYTDLVSVTTTTITSAAKPFGKNQVGNLIKITSGTSWTVQTIEIVSVSSVTATVDKTVGGTGLTGGNGYQGGAFAGPQLAGALAVNSNVIWVKAGAYSITASGSNVANGKFAAGGTTQCISMLGYNSSRGDNSATRPVFTCSASAAGTQFSMNSLSMFKNITIDGGLISGVNGFTGGDTGSESFYCRFQNGNSGSSTGFSIGNWYYCTVDTCNTGYSGGGNAWYSSAVTCTNGIFKNSYYCVAKSCTTGFAGVILMKSIAMSCTTGYSISTVATIVDCVAYNGTNGFVAAANGTSVFLYGCISTNNSSRGYDANTGSINMLNCAGYNNTTADFRYNSSSNILPSMNTGFISLSADPFVSASGGNFALNNSAGGGASLRNIALAFPAIISSTTYEDYGAIQHQPVAVVTTGFAF